MKNNNEILERYLSDDSYDIFGAQRIALLCLLPFEIAKPHLSEEYVAAYEAGTLPEDEIWESNNFDAKANILAYLPDLYQMLDEEAVSDFIESMLHIKALVWVVDEAFHDEISPLYVGDPMENGKAVLDKISTFVGYKPTIEDIDFEEVEKEEGTSSEIK